MIEILLVSIRVKTMYTDEMIKALQQLAEANKRVQDAENARVIDKDKAYSASIIETIATYNKIMPIIAGHNQSLFNHIGVSSITVIFDLALSTSFIILASLLCFIS